MMKASGRAFVVPWRSMDRWVAPGGMTCGDLPAGWQRTHVRKLVTLVSNGVKVEATKEYKMAGVRWYGEGVFHRETVQGDAQSATWIYPLVPGALIYNRLFAWKASFAVVPQDAADWHVSSEFPQFVTDANKVDAEYLLIWCISRQTIRMVNAASTGSAAVSRNRLREEYFLDFELPLPPLSTQQKIVAMWKKEREATAVTAAKIAHLEQEIAAGFMSALGIAAPKQTTLPKVMAATWKDMSRWSVGFNASAKTAIDLSGAKYSMTNLGSVSAVSYGIQKSPANRPGLHARPYLRVANVQRSALDLTEVKYINVPDSELPSLRLQPGDILFVEGNGSKAELGRCALWRGEIPDCVHQNHILKVRPDQAKLLPEYAMTWFNTDVGKEHFFRSAKTSSGLGTINSTELRAAPIILPPLSVQAAMVEHATTLRNEISNLRRSAQVRTDLSKASLEAMMLGAPVPVEQPS